MSNPLLIVLKLGLMVLGCAACAVSPVTPTSVPYWTEFGLRSSASEPDILYLDIETFAFREMGQSGEEVAEQVNDTLQVHIDGDAVDLGIIYVVDTTYPAYTFVILIADLTPGIHALSVQASTTSGIEHSATWDFEVRADHPPILLTPSASA